VPRYDLTAGSPGADGELKIPLNMSKHAVEAAARAMTTAALRRFMLSVSELLAADFSPVR
jgi:hypothetical protein